MQYRYMISFNDIVNYRVLFVNGKDHNFLVDTF